MRLEFNIVPLVAQLVITHTEEVLGMKSRSWLAVALLAFVLCACGRSKPETLVDGGYDEKEMDAAIAQARNEIDGFVANLQKGADQNYAVKAAITDNGKTEHFWLVDVKFADGKFSGKIGNDPGIVTNVKAGQDWSVAKAEVSDWMFMRGGKIHGNYTMRPLLKTLPPQEAEKMRSMLANP